MPVRVVGRAATSRGERPAQLDRMLVWEGSVPGGAAVPVGVYGVFDGHGSHGGRHIVAQLVQDQFLGVLFAQAEWVAAAPGADGTDDVIVALFNTFKVLEERAMDQTRLLKAKDGCSVCVLVTRGLQAFVCNVGDSHAALRSASGAVQLLSTNHTLANDAEYARIPRWARERGLVLGKMPTTRSIGDRDMKRDRTVHQSRSNPVMWEPSIQPFSLADKDELVVATRGLWTKGRVENWCNFAHETLNNKIGFRATAQALVDTAKKASSHKDNVTVIVVSARRDFNGRLRSKDDDIDGNICDGSITVDSGISGRARTLYHAISASGTSR